MSENNEVKEINRHYIRRNEKIYHEDYGLFFGVERVFIIAQTDEDHFEIGFTFYRRANQWQRELRVDSDVYAQLKHFDDVLKSMSENKIGGRLNDPDHFCAYLEVYQIDDLY